MGDAADPYTITAVRDRQLIHIVMRGYWTLDTITGYHQAVKAAVAAMLASGTPHALIAALVDARALNAQSQDAVNSFKDRFDDDQFRPRKLATLVSSALFKRQVERIGLPNQRMFTDEDEAMDWLFSIEGIA